VFAATPREARWVWVSRYPYRNRVAGVTCEHGRVVVTRVLGADMLDKQLVAPTRDHIEFDLRSHTWRRQ